MAKMLDIRTVQLRITGEDEDTAIGGLLSLRELVGLARVMLQRPKSGRDKAGDGLPPWFSYGTFQYEFDAAAVAAYKATKRSQAKRPSAVATSIPVAQPKRRTSTRTPARPKATTGKTTRLKPPKPATGKTMKLSPARPARKSSR